VRRVRVAQCSGINTTGTNDMSELTHAVRANAFETVRTFRFGEDVLYWEEDDARGYMAYADVRHVQLNPDITFATDRAQCVLRDVSGRMLTLTSHHFEGLGRFRNRAQTYAPLVRAVLQRVAADAPEAKFEAGSTTKLAMTLALATIFAILGTLMTLAISDLLSVGTGAVAVLCVLAVSGPVCWYVLQRGGTRTFDPSDPPAKLIGAPS
jgi:hypothetical protein